MQLTNTVLLRYSASQLWTNYKRKSGESLSLVFLYIWLLGDIMNLVGATIDNLLLTMRVLAWYYIVADLAMIAQIYYYRRTSVKGSFESVITHANPEVLNTHDGEHAPLVGGSTSNYSSISPSKHVHENEHERVIHKAAMAANATAANYSGAHHHPHGSAEADYSSSERPAYRQRRPSAHSTTSSFKHRAMMTKRRKTIRKAVIIAFSVMIVAVFIFLYYDWLQCTNGEDPEESDRCGRGRHGGHGRLPPAPSPPNDTDDMIAIMGGKGGRHGGKTAPAHWIPMLMGWGSAMLYLGSRIPQIYKNWRLKSCEGLSVMMFVFSVFGNVFYVASIFIYSLEINYLIKNMPWWIGSGGTLLFDFTIFFQFYIYRSNAPLNEAFQEAAATGELNESALEAAADDESVEEGLESDSPPHLNKNKNNSVDKNHARRQPGTSSN
ncbi:hypothetical protein BGX34_011809, partial [Mortierella sp. NVP85]